MNAPLWLDARDPFQPFPPLSMAQPNGLLAVGGDLSPERLLRAYAQGIFPWYNPGEPILWWSPDPRMVLVPEQFHLSTSLKKRLKQSNGLTWRCNTAFSTVLQHCATSRKRGVGTWLGADMQTAYQQLHARGAAHSIEVWQGERLQGGLYGVAVGRVFFGESMFSLVTDGSKMALAALATQLKRWDFALIDCQVASNHLFSLGAKNVSRSAFEQQLSVANAALPRSWQFDADLADGSFWRGGR